MEKAPEVSVSIRTALISRAVEIAQSSSVWRIGCVVIEVGSRLIPEGKFSLSARSSLSIPSLNPTAINFYRRLVTNLNHPSWLQICKRPSRVSVPAKLSRCLIKLVEKPHVDLSANGWVLIWATKAHSSAIHVIRGLGRCD